MSDTKRLFIVGHPGIGKGVFGKALSQRLGWDLIDADLGLEFHFGRTLNEVLGAAGEKSFLNSESDFLTSTLNKENIIILTDACIVTSEKNRKILETESVIYLKVSTHVQLERVIRDQSPLLNTDLKKFLDQLHIERDNYYENIASVVLNGDDSNIENHVQSIIEFFNLNVFTEFNLDKKDLTIFHKIKKTPVQLTEQQGLCLKLLVEGKSSKNIAKVLNISHRTVEGYIAKTMELLGCSSSKELIALWNKVH